ncbi:hypothetical protein HYFRA_00003126 [Hymenoscyphus fraxineus]|uniref:RRM domain-containing protein n=1 Tax=Hymenoscyphus fraxineus TaxID=746836 RepID=A0A9N9KNA7_9HELO|nr:hypothetical protein HYFRA_00003126 [Hymenoscyphus fraxineus]
MTADTVSAVETGTANTLFQSLVPMAAGGVIVNNMAVDTPTSDDSNFSDAYKEGPTEAQQAGRVEQGTEVSDYAMTFDSEGEGIETDSQDITQANFEQPTALASLPSTVLANLPASSTSTSIPVIPIPGGASASASLITDEEVAIPLRISSHPRTGTATAAPTPSITNVPQSNSPAVQAPAQPATAQSTHTYEAIENGDVDIQQLLDNITAKAEKNEAAAATAQSPSTLSSHLPKLGLPAHSSLPPRPQVPQNVSYSNHDLQKYHAGPPGVLQQSTAYRSPGGAPPSMGGIGINGLPPPPSASFAQIPQSIASPTSQSPHTQFNGHSAQAQSAGNVAQDEHDDIEKRWGPDVQKIYDQFLSDERGYVTQGSWDTFPAGSRLFIGNLPSDKVTKRDLFHVFHKYGKLAQVSIKPAYGFIQFHDTASCYKALQNEQGAEVRGRKMHLEISKPQKNTRNAQPKAQPTRRSRSPQRDNKNGRRGNRNSGGDSYDGRANPRDDYGRHYRPVRSPSPPRNSLRGRDDYGNRGRDPYDSRDRRRSRSRSPYRDNPRYRERSLSPRGREAHEDMELDIPRRDPRDVPDVQIILMDQLDRGFVQWVEGEFHARAIKTQVMFLSPRLPLETVIRRQILEGVHAVSQLNMKSQNSSRVPLQVFDRQGGANNVRFDEYQDLEPKVAAELVVRAKQDSSAPQPPQMPQYGVPYSNGQYNQAPVATTPTVPNFGNIIGQLDNNALQSLLGSINSPAIQNGHQNGPAASANSAIDLAALLGGLQQQHHQPQLNQPQALQQPSYGQPPAVPTADPYAHLASNPALAQFFNGSMQNTQGGPQQSDQQVQSIMASLAKFRP